MADGPVPAITVRNVSYKYPRADETTLHDVSLTVAEGEFVVIMGPAGAGKTTLCLLLNGIIPQLEEGDFQGEVLVRGRNTLKVPIQDLACDVGMVFQDPESQRFGALVDEDAAFGPANLGIPRDEIFARVAQSLAAVKLTGFEKRETDALSGGQKQRLALAGVLAMQPTILVLDEPTSELDPVGTLEVLEVVQRLRRQSGVTVVMVTHSSDEIAPLADRVVLMDHGRIVREGSPREILGNLPHLRQVSVKPPQVAEVFWRLRQAGLLPDGPTPLTDAEGAQMLTAWAARQAIDPGVGDAVAGNGQVEGTPLITIRDLEHVYPGNIAALRGINMEVRQGEFLAIIGQNGSGKSTLVKHFNGLLKPTRGEVRVKGVNTAASTVAALARTVGYVFQNPDHQIFEDTVAKEVSYGPRNMSMSPEEIAAQVSRVLELVGLAGYEERYPFMLGKGERQRIAVASILAMQPEVLIVDEPTTGQDWLGQEGMLGLISDLHRGGHTIVTITHDMDLVARFAQRVIVLQQGRILMTGTPAEVFARGDLLAQTFLDRPPVARFAQSVPFLPAGIVTVDQCVAALAAQLAAPAPSMPAPEGR